MSAHFYDEGPPATGRKVMLAVPTYDDPSAALAFALARSREALHAAGIQTALLILAGNCHVDDSRNALVRDFLESDCTELVFLDADISFEPKDLVQLCSRDVDIVGGVYPYRRHGHADTMPVRLKRGAKPVGGLREVDGLPTGFMKIKRGVFEQMAPTRPWFFAKTERTVLFFDRPPPGEDHVRWGGDLDFCNRWRAMGGKLYADDELRLGHVAKVIVQDSLAASIRRATGTTLRDIIPRFRDGTETENDYEEVFRYVGTLYAAAPFTLALVTKLARKCTGPILETGSGMSSVLMAAVTEQQVYSLEHLEHYAGQTFGWAKEAGVSGLNICFAPITDELWYDVGKFELPNRFSLGFCDGPPRLYNTRMRFFETFGDRCTFIVADDVKSDLGYARKVQEWADANGRSLTMLGRCALIQKIPPVAMEKAA
jgi:predicted O-methyltransferase YrrM